VQNEDAERASQFRQLRWALQNLAGSGSEQRTLFPDSVAKAEELATEFDHSAAAVRTQYETELTGSQSEALDAIDRQLASMSRDGARFDVEIWSETALESSEAWREIRRLAAAALEAFEWPIEKTNEGVDDAAALTELDSR
jgi:hypothetical protein